jgi:hypothetical protein
VLRRAREARGGGGGKGVVHCCLCPCMFMCLRPPHVLYVRHSQVFLRTVHMLLQSAPSSQRELMGRHASR